MAREAGELAIRLKATGYEELRERLVSVGDDAAYAFERVQRQSTSTQSDLSSLVDRTASTASGIAGFIEGAVGKVASLVTGVVSTVGAVGTKVIEIGGAFGVAGGLATAGIGGLVYAARQYTQGIAESISATGDLADELGVSVEALSRMQAAFRVNGADGEKLGGALSTMKLKIVELASGTQSAIDAFGNLGGLTIESFRNPDRTLKGTREQLDILLDRLAKVRNPTLQGKAALDIFGASAKDLGSLISEGSAGLLKAEGDVDKYGTVLKGASRDSLNEALEAQSRLQESLRGMGLTLTKIFFPFFVESSDGLSKWLNENQQRVEGWLKRLLGVAQRVKADIVNVFTMITGGAAAGVAAAAGATGASLSLASFSKDSDDEGEEEEPGKRKGYLTGERTVARTAVVNGKLVDLDRQRAEAAEAAGERVAIVNGEAVRLQGELASKAEETGRRLAIVDGQEVDLDAKKAARQEGAARRTATVNGQEIELAIRKVNFEAGKAGAAAGPFNFPVFAYIGSALRTVAGIAADVAAAVQGRVVGGVVGFLQAVGTAGASAGRAVGGLFSYVYQGITGSVAQIGSFTDLFRGAARLFDSFRAGLARGFETPWAQSLKGAADSVLATLGALEPLIRRSLSGIGDAVQGIANPVRKAADGLTELVVRASAVGDTFASGGLQQGLSRAGAALTGFLGDVTSFGPSVLSTLQNNLGGVAVTITTAISLYMVLSRRWAVITGATALGIAGAMMNSLTTIGKGIDMSGLFSTLSGIPGRILSALTGGMSQANVEKAGSGLPRGLMSLASQSGQAGDQLAAGVLSKSSLTMAVLFGFGVSVIESLSGTSKGMSLLYGALATGVSLLLDVVIGSFSSGGAGSSLASIPSKILSTFTEGLSAERVVSSGAGLQKGSATLVQQMQEFVRINIFNLNAIAETGIKLIAVLVGGYNLFFGSTRGALLSLGAFMLSFGLRFVPQILYAWVRELDAGGATIKSSAASLVQQAAYGVEGEAAGVGARVEKVGLPFLALGGMPGIAARLFGANWIRLQGQFGSAWRQIRLFGNSVIGVMAQIGEWIGLTPIGGPAALGALTVALVATAGYASGAFSILSAVLFGLVGVFALVFYGSTIAAVGLKLLMEVVLFGSRLVLGFAVIMSYAARVGTAAFILMFARIRTVAIAFWAFMALGPRAFVARMAAMYAAVMARTAAFAAFMTLANAAWVFGIIAIVALLAAGIIYMTLGFDGLKDAWDATIAFLVATFVFGMNMIRATSAGLKDLFNEPAKFWTTLITQFWDDFRNLGIDAWNGIKRMTGLDRILGETSRIDRVQTAYRDAAGENADKDVLDPKVRARREAANKVKRRDTEFVDPFPGQSDNDIVTGLDGNYTSKGEAVAAMKAEIKRRDDERYAADLAEAQKKALAPFTPKPIAKDAAGKPVTPAAKDEGLLKGGLRALRDTLFPTMPGLDAPAVGGKGGSPDGMIDTLLKGLGGGEGKPGEKDAFSGLADVLKGFGSKKEGGFPGGGAPVLGDADKSGTAGDERRIVEQGFMDRLIDSMTNNRAYTMQRYPQEGEAPAKKASFDGGGLGRLLGALSGMGQGPATATPYGSGPQKVVAGTEEPLTPGERALAREAAADKERQAREAERDQAVTGQKVVAATVKIEPGDKRLFGNPEAFQALIEALTGAGQRAVVDTAKAV